MNYLFITVITLVTLSCKSISPFNSGDNAELSILQGLTSETATQISVLRHKTQSFTYKTSPATALKVSVKSSPHSDWVVDHLLLNGLESIEYELKVSNQKKIIDTRLFSNFNTNSVDLKIAMASCMDARADQNQQQIWQEFNSHNADLHFFIGDNVYADVGTQQKGMATAAELWQKYTETRQKLFIYKVKKLTPTLATWDDHDFGNNGGGINYPYKEESLKTFFSFFPTDTQHISLAKGPGLSYMLMAGQQNFYFMDNRSFRTNKKTKPGYHWGSQQQSWLINHLKENKKFSWLINGNQFFGQYHRFESFEKNHATNFVEFIGQLKKIPTKVGFLSGDRHLTELMKIKQPDLPYETFELTTSAIHAKVYPSSWGKSPNPRQIYGKANALNYAVVDTLKTDKNLTIKIQAFGLNKELFYKYSQLIK